jgi:serine-aspartate repeat-containing protein C/D/E
MRKIIMNKIRSIMLVSILLSSSLAMFTMSAQPALAAVGRQDTAIFSTGGTWIIDTNRNGYFDPGIDWSNSPNTFGSTIGDVPLAIDWDGDGIQEMAIFRQGGTWFIDMNHNGAFEAGVDWSNSPNTFGRTAGDVPLAIDADGDGVQELAIFRQGGTWFIDMNHNGAFEAGVDWSNSPNTFGRTAGDVPLAIDWDGDGIQELCIFRQGGTWFIDMNHNGAFEVGVDWSNSPNTFGRTAGDVPLAIDYDGDGIQELGIYRSGTWFGDMNHNGAFEIGIDLTNSPNTFGQASDIPVVIG